MWSDGGREHLLDDPWAPHPVVNRHICSNGGGSGQTSTSNFAQNEPPVFIQGGLKKALGDLSALYDANPNAPKFFPGSTVAPMSDYTTSAIDALAARGASGSPLQSGANTALTDTLNGKYLDPTTNPAYLAALSASHQPYIDQFTNQIIPGITSAFEGSGRTAGGAHQSAVDQATTGLNRTISDADAKAGSDYFSTERNRMLGAAGLAPQIAGLDYQNIEALGAAGAQKDAYKQAQINEDINRYNYNNDAQWNYINRYLASLNAGYPGGTTTSNSMSFGTQPGGGAGSIFGNAMGLAGLGLQAYSAFSDVRLKENIHRVGQTDDGQNLYFYNYKGDPTPQVGLMAQEVEQIKPDAVVEHPSGYKVVNYRKAMGLF